MGIHSTYLLIVDLFFYDEPWKDQLIPFALLYGPIIYFAIIALRDNYIKPRTIIVHLLPFLIYFAFCLFTLSYDIGAFEQKRVKYIFILSPISFVSYSIWTVFLGREVFNGKFSKKRLIFTFIRMILMFLALVFIFVFFSNQVKLQVPAINFLRTIVYGCMLVAAIVLFVYITDGIFKNKPDLAVKTGRYNKSFSKELLKYEHSALSTAQLDLYYQKLILIVEQEKVYLNKELSLTKLASIIKIPNHHLTQVFSVRVCQTFYQYINGFRIIHACNLLKSTSKNLALEEIAEQSGFNSKVSFNRQFKLIMNCTPSEYRLKAVS
jgi:AraC-like DNA-binding protein